MTLTRHLCMQVGDWEAAAPFLAGGCGGLLYQFSLQAGVDTVPAPHEVPAPCTVPRCACAQPEHQPDKITTRVSLRITSLCMWLSYPRCLLLGASPNCSPSMWI